MTLDDIQRYLQRTIGLEVDSVGGTIIERAVRQRMDICGVGQVAAYGELIQHSESELQALINEITVPETWFFRDSTPFVVLAQLAKRYLKTHNSQPLRILSIPCSTGEEPYSIAMTLLDAGYTTQQFCVDAVDISTESLAKAKLGCYGDHSFRGDKLEFRRRYFSREGQCYRINDELKAVVHFQRGNILDERFMAGKGPYHVIFCRNLLIYFGLENKEKALTLLHALLTGDGVLFLGHAETGRMAEGLFSPLGVSGAFAYRKETRQRPAASPLEFPVVTPRRRSRRPVVRAALVAQHDGPLVQRADTGFETETAMALVESLDDRLEEIESLADSGDLVRAETLCDQFLRDHPEVAQGYYLKGIINLARNDDSGAHDCFRKAAYLDPGHYQALVHLAVLADKRGEAGAARNYRARAERLNH